MSYSEARLHLRMNNWSQEITQYAIMYSKSLHHQIHYRTDIRHFEAKTWNDETILAAKQANAVLFGGFHALQHIK